MESCLNWKVEVKDIQKNFDKNSIEELRDIYIGTTRYGKEVSKDMVKKVKKDYIKK